MTEIIFWVEDDVEGGYVARGHYGDGFLITTYPTDSIKEGEMIWQK